MKRILAVTAAIVLLFALMFAEYRVIMHNIRPYVQGNTVYLEIFGHQDTYYAEDIGVCFEKGDENLIRPQSD